MANQTITALFDSYDAAAKAVRRIEAAGIPNQNISLVAGNRDDLYSHHATHSFDQEEQVSGSAAAGASIGTLAGGGAGLLAGLGMLALPGVGPVVAAGWLVSTLIGAGAGAAVGGLAGALVGEGLTEEEAHSYAEGVRRGGALVTVKADMKEADRVIAILDDEGRVDLSDRERGGGWEGSVPPIGAAASTTTGLTTDLMPIPGDEDRSRTEVEVENERLLRGTGTDKEG